MSKLVRALVCAVLAITPIAVAQPSHAAAGDAWVPSMANVGQGNTSFFIAEDTQGNLMTTRTANTYATDGQYYDVWCNDFTTSDCDLNNPKISFHGYSVLPVCSTTSQENCVESLGITIPGKDEVQAKFVRNIDGIKFAANPKLGLYEASTISLWDAPGAPSEGGYTTYAVNVRTEINYDRVTGSFETIGMNAIVMPYRLQTGNYGLPTPDTIQNSKGTTHPGVAIYGIAQECVWNDKGECGMLQNFQTGTVVKLATRLTNQVGGWFKGRMAKPDISVSPFSSTANRIVVQAQSVNVPRLQATVSSPNAPAGIRDLFVHSGVMGGLWEGAQAFTENHGDEAFTYLSTFKDYAKDTIAGISNLWSFGTVKSGDGSACLWDTSKVLGIVTTNSMVFDGASPAFVDGALSYKVGGLHFMPDGVTPVTGQYDLVMRSDTARCLYGFSKAPVSASVSVTASNGESKVATVIVNEQDNWLHLGAYDFTFSSPTIKVALSQAKPVSNVKTAITCKKGKTVKQISGVSPKCPAGYKKS